MPALSPVPPSPGAIILYHAGPRMSTLFSKKFFYFFSKKVLTNRHKGAILTSSREARKSLKNQKGKPP